MMNERSRKSKGEGTWRLSEDLGKNKEKEGEG